MEVRRPVICFYPLSLFYTYINFIGYLDREEIMHWCKIICNKFLTLGFGCVQEGLLRFQGRTISPVFGWECFAHDDNGDKEEH
jgi:hypothetical protein